MKNEKGKNRYKNDNSRGCVVVYVYIPTIYNYKAAIGRVLYNKSVFRIPEFHRGPRGKSAAGGGGVVCSEHP